MLPQLPEKRRGGRARPADAIAPHSARLAPHSRSLPLLPMKPPWAPPQLPWGPSDQIVPKGIFNKHTHTPAMLTVTGSSPHKHIFLQLGRRVLSGLSVFTFLPSCPFGGNKVHKQAARR